MLSIFMRIVKMYCLIQEVEHGEFSVTEGHQKSVDSSNSFAVYRIPDVDGLYQDREGSYYLQCTNKTLLRVNQVAVPIEDIEAVEEIASTFSLPEMLVSDLRMLSEAIQNEENAQILVELYVPYDTEMKSVVEGDPYYYTYKGYRVRDIVWHTEYMTPFREYEYDGLDTIDNVNNIAGFVMSCVSALGVNVLSAAPITSSAYGMLSGWINDWGESRLQPTNDDWAQFSVDYTSNTKFTEVDFGGGGYQTCAKTGDCTINEHGIIAYINDKRSETWYSIDQYEETPNYDEPAAKAIISPSQPWVETLEYEFGDFTIVPNEPGYPGVVIVYETHMPSRTACSRHSVALGVDRLSGNGTGRHICTERTGLVPGGMDRHADGRTRTDR